MNSLQIPVHQPIAHSSDHRNLIVVLQSVLWYGSLAVIFSLAVGIFSLMPTYLLNDVYGFHITSLEVLIESLGLGMVLALLIAYSITVNNH